jgi:nucleotide-binding universal stress UspA family protein
MSDPTTGGVVLAGYDGSPASKAAVAWAAAEAGRRGSTLVIARCYDPPVEFTDLAWTPVGLPMDGTRGEHCGRATRELAAGYRSSLPDVRAVIRPGHPREVLPILAEQLDADVTVLGCADHTALSRMILGSTAADLVHATTRPVVVVHPGAADGPVVLGLADTDEDARAVEFAFTFAARHGAEVHAVHGGRGELEQRVAPLRSRYPQVTVRMESIADRPAHALVERSTGARLLVVGSHHHGALHRALRGSVSHRALFHAACPVAVVPSGIKATTTPTPMHATS